MKIHLSKQEKNDLRYVLSNIDQCIIYKIKDGEDISEVLKKEMAEAIGNEVDIWKNTTSDIRFDYVLYFNEAEVGLSISSEYEGEFKIDNIIFFEH